MKGLIDSADNQGSQFGKNYFIFQSTFLGVFKNGNYNLAIKASDEESDFESFLYNDSGTSGAENFRNDLRYSKSTIQHSGNLTYKVAKWKFNSSYSLIHLKQRFPYQ